MRAEQIAAADPAGPAPTTMTSAEDEICLRNLAVKHPLHAESDTRNVTRWSVVLIEAHKHKMETGSGEP
jgi:hypothetical protein